MILFLGGAHLAYTTFTHKFNPTKCITRPAIGEIVVTSDGFVLTGVDDDLGGNHFLGTYADLLRNWLALIAVAGLTKEERITARFALRQQNRIFRARGRLRNGAMDNLRVALYARVSTLLAQVPKCN